MPFTLTKHIRFAVHSLVFLGKLPSSLLCCYSSWHFPQFYFPFVSQAHLHTLFNYGTFLCRQIICTARHAWRQTYISVHGNPDSQHPAKVVIWRDFFRGSSRCGGKNQISVPGMFLTWVHCVISLTLSLLILNGYNIIFLSLPASVFPSGGQGWEHVWHSVSTWKCYFITVKMAFTFSVSN